MRLFSVLLAVTGLLSAASGQVLEMTVPLPDSLGGVFGGRGLVVSSATGRCLAGGSKGSVVVLDSRTWTKLARVDVGQSVTAMAMDPTGTKVYAASGPGCLAVLDAATGVLIRVLYLSGVPVVLLCDSSRNRLYCASKSPGRLAVIDCASDSVLTTIEFGTSLAAMCTDGTNSKLYFADSSSATVGVLALDGDSLLTTIAVRDGPVGLCNDPTRNRIYCAASDDNRVSVIDVLADSVVKTIRVSGGPTMLSYDSADDKVHVLCESGLRVIDCTADTLMASISLGSTATMLRNPVSNRLYVALAYGGVCVVDCAADSELTTLPTETVVRSLWLDVSSSWLWLMERQGGRLYIADAAADTLLGTVLLGCHPGGVCFSSASDKLFAVCGQEKEVVVIDGSSLGIRRRIALPHYSLTTCYNPVADRVYLGSSSGSALTVVDCAAESVVADIGIPAGDEYRLCCNPRDNKVYCTSNSGGTLAVIDCNSDSVSRVLQMPGAREMCYNPDANRLYVRCVGRDTVLVIDGSTDSVVAAFDPQVSAEAVMCYCPTDSMLYIGDYMNCFVQVVDTRTHIIMRTHWVFGPVSMCVDQSDDKVFIPSASWDGYMYVLDAGTQTLDSISVGGIGFMADAFWNPLSDLVYVANYDLVVVLEGATNRVVATFPADMQIGLDVASFVSDPTRSRVFAASTYGSSILVMKDTARVGVTVSRDAATVAEMTSTVVRGWLSVGGVSSVCRDGSLVLVDITGRRVVDLHPGPNDVRHLGAGVYFVRAAQAQAQAQTVHKVVVTR